MINLESLGYKDITKDNPIHFIECLRDLFESTWPYSKRFYKKDGIIDIELKVGNIYDLVFISGVCYFSKGWQKFELCGPSKHIEQMFQRTLDAVKQTIFNSYKEDLLMKEKYVKPQIKVENADPVEMICYSSGGFDPGAMP